MALSSLCRLDGSHVSRFDGELHGGELVIGLLERDDNHVVNQHPVRDAEVEVIRTDVEYGHACVTEELTTGCCHTSVVEDEAHKQAVVGARSVTSGDQLHLAPRSALARCFDGMSLGDMLALNARIRKLPDEHPRKWSFLKQWGVANEELKARGQGAA